MVTETERDAVTRFFQPLIEKVAANGGYQMIVPAADSFRDIPVDDTDRYETARQSFQDRTDTGELTDVHDAVLMAAEAYAEAGFPIGLIDPSLGGPVTNFRSAAHLQDVYDGTSKTDPEMKMADTVDVRTDAEKAAIDARNPNASAAQASDVEERRNNPDYVGGVK